MKIQVCLLFLIVLMSAEHSSSACTVIENFQDESSSKNWKYIELGGIDLDKLKSEMCRGYAVKTIKLTKIDGPTGDITANADGCNYIIKLDSYSEIATDDYKVKCQSSGIVIDKILSNSDGSRAVLCSDGSHGTITFPDQSICAIGNGKSDCKVRNNWSIQQAANYICM